MYVWRGKNRRDKRNLRLLGETFWGAAKGATSNEVADARLREELEEKHVDYYAVKVRALMEMYMTNKGGKNEIALLIEVLNRADSRLAGFVHSDDINELRREEIKANLYDIFKLYTLPGMDLIDEQGLAKLFADLQMTLTKKEFYAYLKRLNITTKDTAVDFDGFYEVLMEEMISQQERREEMQRAKAALRERVNEMAHSLKLAVFGDPEKNPKEIMRRRIEQRRKEETGEAEQERRTAAENKRKREEREEEDRRNKANLSYKVQRRLQTNAAKMLLVDHAVHVAMKLAREEYRIAHPCPHVCVHCDRSFADRRSMLDHSKDRALHVKILSKQLADQERFQYVESIFVGEQGRRLRADRLMFSEELGSLQYRVDAVKEDPFRPNIADAGGKRYQQQLNGSFVQGFDPKAGIRPAHRRMGLLRQHLVTQRRAPASNSLIQVSEPRLQDVLHNLLRCKDNFIDTVSTCDNPMNLNFQLQVKRGESAAEYSSNMQSEFNAIGGKNFHKVRETDAVGRDQHDLNNSHGMCAIVRFQWNQFARNQVFIKGEFTGWQAVQMTCDVKSGIFCKTLQLTPGRYRYRFIIDGTELIDEAASSVEDSGSPIGCSNEILVTNTPLFHLEHKDLKVPMKPGERIDTPLQAASKRHYQQKLGLAEAQVAQQQSQGEMVYNHMKGYHFGGTAGGLQQGATLQSMDQEAVVMVDDITATAKDASRRKRRENILDVKLDSPLRSSSGKSESRADSYSRSIHRSSSSRELERQQEDPVGQITHMSRTDKKALMRRLEHINLRNLSLYDDGAWALSSYVSENNFIKIVDLSYNCISDEGVQAFSCCLPLMHALETLRLNGNGFGFDGIRYLCNGLQSCNQLGCIELASNRLGDDAMEELCQYLRYNEHVKEIYMDSNLIGNDGMECLYQALLNNRRLERLNLIDNRITTFGINRLTRALQFNASVTHLALSNNDLGPEAVKFVGDFVYTSDCIRTLELAHVGLLGLKVDDTKGGKGRSGSSFGLNGLCYGIKQNKSLTSLNLRNNSLRDPHAADLAHAMSINESLTHLDVDGNYITKPWLQPETTIPTHILPQMPSLRSSIDRNKRLLRDRVSAVGNNDEENHILDDVQHGKWNNRRQWKREEQNREQRNAQKRQRALEHQRIEEEVQYIRNTLANWMEVVRQYMSQAPCRQYVRTVAKCITEYLHDLASFDAAEYESQELELDRQTVLTTAQSRRSASVKMKAANAGPRRNNTSQNGSPLQRQISRTFSATSIGTNSSGLTAAATVRDLLPGRLTSLLLLQSRKESSPDALPIHLESFLNAHISVVNTVFNILDGGSSTSCLMLPPMRLPQAMQRLALPIPDDEVQAAVDSTIIPFSGSIGIHKFSEYVLHNAKRLVDRSRFQRLRIMADLAMNPPIEEAETLILNHLQHMFIDELRDKYRSVPANRPLFACTHCHKRFATQRQFDRHIARGNFGKDHRRHRAKEVVHHSQTLFLQRVKWMLNGIFFPAYYELQPSSALPAHFIPQVKDKIGAEGRPFGVLEPRRTVRAVDVFGEYLHIVWRGQLGWVHYRSGPQHYLKPVCDGVPGFDWDTLHLQEDLTYYRVNDTLSDAVELKVRHQPTADGEVVGYLRRNQVIECMAVIGDWLQVRFENEDAAWIRWRPSADDPRFAAAATAAMRATTTSTAIQSRAVSRAEIQQEGAVDDVANYRSSLLSSPFATSMRSLASGDLFRGGTRSKQTADAPASPDRQPKQRNQKNATAPLSPLARSRLKLMTPGEQREAVDHFFDDHLMTYEIDGKDVRVNTKKNKHITRFKIDYFNKVRYGSTEEGTTHCTLLLLPRHLQHQLIPPLDPNDTSGQRELPASPQVVVQQQVFDAVMQCSEKELIGPVQYAAPEGELQQILHDWDAEGSRRLNRFGRSEKDSIYRAHDEEDDVEAQLQHSAEGASDDDSIGRTAAALSSLQDYDFPQPRGSKK